MTNFWDTRTGEVFSTFAGATLMGLLFLAGTGGLAFIAAMLWRLAYTAATTGLKP